MPVIEIKIIRISYYKDRERFKALARFYEATIIFLRVFSALKGRDTEPTKKEGYKTSLNAVVVAIAVFDLQSLLSRETAKLDANSQRALRLKGEQNIRQTLSLDHFN